MKLDFYSDPGHGWLAVPLELLDLLGLVDKVSTYSYIYGGRAHLEEDCDYSLFAAAMNERKIPFTIREHRCNGRSRIRSYQCYHPTTAKRNIFNMQKNQVSGAIIAALVRGAPHQPTLKG
jgi:hypothetical protein